MRGYFSKLIDYPWLSLSSAVLWGVLEFIALQRRQPGRPDMKHRHHA